MTQDKDAGLYDEDDTRPCSRGHLILHRRLDRNVSPWVLSLEQPGEHSLPIS